MTMELAVDIMRNLLKLGLLPYPFGTATVVGLLVSFIHPLQVYNKLYFRAQVVLFPWPIFFQQISF